MKVYLAGQCPYLQAREYAERVHGRFLHSYAYMRTKKIEDLRAWWADKDIMVDSGAFTVGNRGKAISINSYGEFLRRLHPEYYTVCINLDVNPVSAAMRNQQILESMGIRPMPVYHLAEWASREHRGLLQRFIDSGHDYIGLGGVAGMVLSKSHVRNFLDFCFVTSGKNVKLHGLGMSSTTLMVHYPFYSVDSKTWLVSGLYGDYITTKNAKYHRVPKKRGSISHYGVLLPGPEKMKRTVDAFVQLEKHATAIWKKRGYVWN